MISNKKKCSGLEFEGSTSSQLKNVNTYVTVRCLRPVPTSLETQLVINLELNWTVSWVWTMFLWASVLLWSWKPFRPFSRSGGDVRKVEHSLCGGGESYFLIVVKLAPPQLELICGALLSHSHLMENICCHAFYYSQQRYVCLYGG